MWGRGVVEAAVLIETDHRDADKGGSNRVYIEKWGIIGKRATCFSSLIFPLWLAFA